MKYRNAKYINDSGWVECEINHPEFGWIPYGLNPADTDMTVNNDDLLAAMAKAGDVAAYVPPTQAELDEALSAQLRMDRDALLSKVDAIAGNALRWSALDDKVQAAWAAYRQDLLDIPQQSGFPINVNWPVKPSE